MLADIIQSSPEMLSVIPGKKPGGGTGCAFNDPLPNKC